MAKFVFAYHGGGMPEDEADIPKVMAACDALIDPGNPIGETKTVNTDGSVTVGGGANPLSGYSLFTAASLDEAVAAAKGCPILESGGSVEVAAAVDM